ncbi:hypothetical protein PHMEG_00018025 [Phytophthora megakarya]|uniref:Uncharacterized protein n=1 Tax=Phytophthora megakarya TaxID=4795 RepID=A0A225VWX0_9STRA|nr:hypothetical protein PHMEG_00018025 [Phytophthora megakarya]
MESMRGAMAEVDLFIYVLEKEVANFQRKPFPMELQLDSSSPFECLIPLEKEATNAPVWAGSRDTLALRHPSNEMEMCRKAMRVFLNLRKLREFLDESYLDDELEQIVAYRHPRTSILASAAGEDCAQAQAHINISGTEVRAFKLHQIEESLTAHLQVTQSSNSERRGSFFAKIEGLNNEDESESSEEAESDDDDDNEEEMEKGD